MANYTDFICKQPGENSAAVNSPGMPVGNTVTINGKEDLSEFIKFNDGGCIYSIRLLDNPSVSMYSYELEVDGCGPEGAGSGKGYLYFTDATGDTYKLTLYRSGRHKHVVDYNSRDPKITTITWSNKSK